MIPSQIDQRQEDILLEILRRCRGRLLKHIERFLNELRQAHCRPLNQYHTPPYVSEFGSTEATQDIERLGIHSRENHSIYMQACRDRLNQLRNLSAELICPSNRSNFQEMLVLTKVAYDVRRSSSFRQYLNHNLQKTKRPEAMVPIVGSIIERLGKISRFYRAAMTIAAFGMKLLKRNITIKVEAVPAPKVQIPELNGRTTAQLRLRGGYRFISCSEGQLQGMIKRWPTYRLHSEIQLIVFYEENPNLKLYSNYIGCDKLSCYLCYSFVKHHGHFSVNGCHQALYSLWAVPDIVSFENEKCADHFRKALKELCNDLEHKMALLRGRQVLRPQYAWNNESVANLSRLSLPLTANTVEQGSLEQSTYEGSISSRQTRFATSTSPAASQNSLATIPEVCPTEQAENTTPSAIETIPAEKLETSPPAIDMHTETVKLGPILVGITPVLANAISKSPREESQTERPEPKKHLKRRQRRRHSHHGHHKYRIDRSWIGEDCSSRRTSRQKPVDGVRHRQRRNHLSQARRPRGQNWSSNRYLPRREYRHQSGSSQTKKSGAGFLYRLWEFCSLVMDGCVCKPRRAKRLDNLAERPSRREK